MHPVLFKFGSFTIFTYGFFIALGAVLGGLLMWRQSKRLYGMTFDQANNLFVLLIVAGVLGGKLFVIFEDPTFYFSHPKELLSKGGFVFYGSLLTAIPVMLWFFKKNHLPVRGMLDVMALVTCVIHGFGRIGCFSAGCCYGKPTTSGFGVTFSDPLCAAPLHTPLHPSQLYESAFIFTLLTFLFWLHRKKKFEGQVFLVYLILYGLGRIVLEVFRGDPGRGFIVDGLVSNSQLISLLVVLCAAYFYVKLKRNANFQLANKTNHGK